MKKLNFFERRHLKKIFRKYSLGYIEQLIDSYSLVIKDSLSDIKPYYQEFYELLIKEKNRRKER